MNRRQQHVLRSFDHVLAYLAADTLATPCIKAARSISNASGRDAGDTDRADERIEDAWRARG